MKLSFWSIGKPNDPYVHTGVEEFTKRISRYFKTGWTIIPVPKNANALSLPDQKKKEAVLVLERLDKDDFLVVLDEKGKQLNSASLASFLQLRANEGQKQIVFLIGGAYGIDESVLRRAGFTWCLSELTFPHQLVRLILAEQVYRACTIMRNEKYHHE